MKLFLFWLAVISLISVIITVHDKIAAKRRRTRVPESFLILLGLMGGSAAMFLTMLVIRHKTRHAKFMVGLPIIIAAQAALVLWVIMK